MIRSSNFKNKRIYNDCHSMHCQALGVIKSQNYEPNVSGFMMNAKGEMEIEQGKVRGHIEATSGFFKGRIEAEEGFFRGLLETPALRSSTETVFSSTRSYNAGTGSWDLSISEANFWGESISSGWSRTYDVVGTYGGQAITQIVFSIPQGRPIIPQTVISIKYNNNTWAYLNDIQSLTGVLSFKRITQGWNVQIRNLPIRDPKIPNVLWRDGATLKISLG